ncbi:GNAT family N-acetyltransferase [Aureisphaera galaxeae]|uniref:aminoglycoside 6'-N-acetyltransferase n=1 Tax=Aureisphaera galaxeae TaxID=1538023 RepID=UPI0023509FBA|nr:aminoglycoside 6'-N-acetyltransferase [Aureisphaera galaxeae]MDC8003666.1 GNAT family N-acetyltransferase [Aureisphaera galaxeae]
MHSINELSSDNLKVIAELAFTLWPDSSLQEELDYFAKAIEDVGKSAFLLKVADKDAGFVHVSLRNDYVEGTTTKPVCYLEGIYIEPEYRRKGYAELLMQQAEQWGKQMNCTEIASDAEIGNEASIALHKHVGFKEINRIVCFAKRIK